MDMENTKILGIYWSFKPDCLKLMTNMKRIKDEIFVIWLSRYSYTVNGKLLLQNIEVYEKKE